MKYASSLIGLPVISYATGEKLEKVEDIIYQDSDNTVLGLLVDTGGWFAAARVVPFSQIKSIGEDAVIIPSEQAIIQAETDPALQVAVETNNVVKGKQVMTEDGKNLGTVADLAFDEVSGRVEGYQVTGGLFADMYKGKPFVPAPQTIKVGDDVLFVPNNTLQLMEEQAGGMKGVAQSAGDKLQDIKDSTTSKVEGVRSQVTSPDTQQKMDKAKLDAKGKVEDLKGQASDLWSTMKERAGELKSQADQKMEETQIKNALGKPVTRVILDKQDKVILNTGELITHQAVEKARSAQVLDLLLGSVSNQKPYLSNEDLKAKAAAR